MGRYVRLLAGPLLLLFVSAVFVQVVSTVSFASMLVSLGALVIAPAWAGWLLVVRAKVSPWAAAFCGPALLFVDAFVFGYLPSLALGRISELSQQAADNPLLASPGLTVLAGMLIGYLLIFPISLGLAGLGAYIGARDLRRASPGLPEDKPS
jgi:hypothetical protein